jgi:hypothetical protein
MDTIIVAVATTVAILTSFYLFGLSQLDDLKKNWVEYRCNPVYMPMASLVGDSIVSNFTKCTLKSFSDYTGFVMDPIMGEFAVVNETLGEVTTTLSSMRSMFSGVRGGFLGVVGSVFGKIQNLMSQTQYIIIRMRTLLGRVVGVMFSFIYIFYGGMQSGQSLVNGPVGSAMSFLCFDENTRVPTFRGILPIKDVVIGDRLSGNLAVVTSTYKLDGKGIQMYDLSGILVTGSHKVKHKGKYIRIDKHPLAKKMKKECNRLVCLNTNTGKISIRNHEFLDFDEIDDNDFLQFKHKYIQALYNSTSKSEFIKEKTGILPGTHISLSGNCTTTVEQIQIGDVLDNGDVVKGVCIHKLINKYYVEIARGILASPNTWIYENNSIRKASDLGKQILHQDTDYLTVYQLITDSSIYPLLSMDDNRVLILDELETTDPFYHNLKDSIIETGSFRGKRIVV